MDPGIPRADLLAYNADENARWHRWFGEHAARPWIFPATWRARARSENCFCTSLPPNSSSPVASSTCQRSTTRIFRTRPGANYLRSGQRRTENSSNSSRRRHPKSGRPWSLSVCVISRPANARWSRKPCCTACIIADNSPRFCGSRDSSKIGRMTSSRAKPCFDRNYSFSPFR